MLRWAPVAVARLIQDLESDTPAEARQAAREILKLALDAQRDLAPPAEAAAGLAAAARAADSGGGTGDPLSRRVAALSDDQLARVLAILNGEAVPQRKG